MRRGLPLLLFCAGCSGGPLKEMPVLEAPPPLEDPAPPPAPTAAESPVEPAPPSLVGAWRSTALSGPGSAAIERLVLVFEPEGGLSGTAFTRGGARTLAGRYGEEDGTLQADLEAGDVRRWSMELSSGTLVLRDGDQEMRLARILETSLGSPRR